MLSAEDNELLTLTGPGIDVMRARFGDPIGRVPSLRVAAPARR